MMIDINDWTSPTNPELAAAISVAVPDLADAAKLAQICSAHAADAQPVGPLPNPHETVAAFGRLVERDGITAAVMTIEPQLDQVGAQARAELEARCWQHAASTVNSGIVNLLNSRADAMLSHLDAVLQDVMRAAQAVKGDDLAAVVARHELLRDAQAKITHEFGSDGQGQHSRTFAYFSNFTDLWPAWFEPGSRASDGMRFTEGVTAPAQDRSTSGVPVPWPSDSTGMFLWAVGNPLARPWIPTRLELDQAVAASRLLAQQIRNRRTGLTPQAYGRPRYSEADVARMAADHGQAMTSQPGPSGVVPVVAPTA